MAKAQRVGVLGATGIGLGAMLGAGVFTVWPVAALRSGEWLLVSVGIAAVVATVNAMSTAQLAAAHPVAGGAYTYGQREWHPVAGFVAGIGFVVGKTASIAAIALAIGLYVAPDFPQLIATLAIVGAWSLNARGITRTAVVATAVAAVVLTVVTVTLITSTAAVPPMWPDLSHPPTPGGLLGASAIVFFAFAGYARMATMGEEARDPVRTVPRAIVVALVVVLALYLATAAVLHATLGTEALQATQAPLRDLAVLGSMPTVVLAVTAGLAAAGSLVALMAGVGRTTMAMARNADVPRVLARQGSTGAPWVAEGVVGAVAIAAVWWSGLDTAIAMSSCAVLVYYAVANVAAHRARRAPGATMRLWPGVSVVGALLCITLALALPWHVVVATVGSLGVAVAARALVRRAT